MLTPAPPLYLVRCDVCSATAQVAADVGAPPGFVRLDAHPRTGLGATYHACLAGCLVTLANRLKREAARVVTVPR